MDNQIQQALTVLQQGGVIAYPTEGVYGLGCDPDNANAVQKILDLKEREIEKGLILVASSVEQFNAYLEPFTPELENKVIPTWPGPVTWLLPVKDSVPELLKGSHQTLAVRIPDHPVVQALCKAFNKPIVSTSANKAGEDPALTAQQVEDVFGDEIDFVIDAPLGGRTTPSEIRDALTGNIIRS